MLDKKAQASFEVLLLLALIFIGVVFVISIFSQVNDATLAVELAKVAVLEKLQSLDNFYYIERIDFEETDSTIELKVFVKPNNTELATIDFSPEEAKIAGKTKYDTVTISINP